MNLIPLFYLGKKLSKLRFMTWDKIKWWIYNKKWINFGAMLLFSIQGYANQLSNEKPFSLL